MIDYIFMFYQFIPPKYRKNFLEFMYWRHVLRFCKQNSVFLKSDKNNRNSPEYLAHLFHWLSYPRQVFLREIRVEAEETVNDLETTIEKIVYARRAEVEETVDYQILLTLNLLTWIEHIAAKRSKKLTGLLQFKSKNAKLY